MRRDFKSTVDPFYEFNRPLDSRRQRQQHQSFSLVLSISVAFSSSHRINSLPVLKYCRWFPQLILLQASSSSRSPPCILLLHLYRTPRLYPPPPPFHCLHLLPGKSSSLYPSSTSPLQ